MLDVGHTEETVAIHFGVEVPTVRQQLKLLDCTAAVRDALEADQITVSNALKLAKLAPEQQREKVRAVIAAADGKEGHERSRAQKAALTGDAAPRMRTRKQIAAELTNATGERAEALRWVLNLADSEPGAEEADPRQLSIDEAA
ncbi:putative chromosome partitioning protein [Burkholderia sp. AU4i]|nr:putative chromosome partitioning protein [Burkholderia sp. AU4i]